MEGEDWRRAVEVALEYESATGDRPLDIGGEDGDGTGRGLEGDEVCLWIDIVLKGVA